jgi:ABC-2 type transport system ATP-binding protein
MIRFENVTKRFGSGSRPKFAVLDLSLEVPRGELFAFLGPNGAGKTTTIKMMVGLLRPTSGRILIDGCDIQGNAEKIKRKIAYVPEEPFLYDKLSGYEFLQFIADVYEIDKKGRLSQINNMIEVFSMKDYINDLIESYSAGMKQRLVLSSVLLHNPEIIVVDEPLVGLDPATSRLVRNIFRKKVGEGKTIFMSTHIISVAEEIADRIGIIIDSRLITTGTIDELATYSNTSSKKLEDIFFKLTQNKQ